MDIKELLKKAAGDILTEETLTAIETAYTSAVDEKADKAVKDRLQLEVTNALTKQDEEHTGKLQKLIEAIDSDHVKKLKAVVQKLDENHSNKLKFLVKKYDEKLQTEAATLRDSIVNELSNYLDLYLDKLVPTETIKEAYDNSQARKMIDNIKKIIAVDSSFVTEQIREALRDGKAKMEEQEKKLNTVIKENVDLHRAKTKAEAELILEKKTHGLPDDKKNYIVKILADKDPEYITENFNHVVEMFERDTQEEADLLTESAKDKAVTRNVDTPVITEEAKKGENSDAPVTEYLSELKRGDRNRA